MPDTVIRVDDLSKMYQIGAARHKSGGLRHVIEHGFQQLGQRLRGRFASDTTTEEFWALRNVSFEVKRGECLGVLGRNGAGKSTLLKILSRITEPTSGEVGLRGRVGSLLEVGSGFHVELTGRENIFLNGAILGMSRKEIVRKFDDIVAFSEVEKFLDTPVKRYSSGMYMRLAFAVAAHMEPDILIVDEVLAVGDSQFQKKCLGKMGEVTQGGRTVLFVSHDLATVRSLCSSCCVMERGQLAFQGSAEAGVDFYLQESTPAGLTHCRDFAPPAPNVPWMRSASLTSGGRPAALVRLGDELTVAVNFAAPIPISHPRLGVIISDDEGCPLVSAHNRYLPVAKSDLRWSCGSLICELGVVPLMPGRYRISLWFGDVAHDTHREEGALSFEVLDHDAWGSGKTPVHVCDGSALWWPGRFLLAPDDGCSN